MRKMFRAVASRRQITFVADNAMVDTQSIEEWSIAYRFGTGFCNGRVPDAARLETG
jgi:hypothetical protein